MLGTLSEQQDKNGRIVWKYREDDFRMTLHYFGKMTGWVVDISRANPDPCPTLGNDDSWYLESRETFGEDRDEAQAYFLRTANNEE